MELYGLVEKRFCTYKYKVDIIFYFTKIRYYSMIYDEPVNNMLLAAGTEVVKD
jgi:hypothetical protein